MWKYRRCLFGILTGILLCVCVIGGVLVALDGVKGGPSDGNVIGIPGSDLVVVPEGTTSDFSTSTESTVPVPPIDDDGDGNGGTPVADGRLKLLGISVLVGNRGQSLAVGISGSNLSGTSRVSFGQGIAILQLVTVDSSLLSVDIKIDWTADIGKRSITVTGSSGTATLTGAFLVECPIPEVLTVSPTKLILGKSCGVEIVGSGFYDTSAIDMGEGLEVTNFEVASESVLSVDVEVSSKSPKGKKSVSVTTPGGTGFLRDAIVVSGETSDLSGLSSKILPGGLLVGGILSILSWKKRELLWCTLASSSWFVLAILCAVGKIIEFEIVSNGMSIIGAVSFLVIAILVLLLQLRPKEAETPAVVGNGVRKSYRQLKAEADEKRRELRKRMLH